MNSQTETTQRSLPPKIQDLLTQLVQSAKASFGDDLKSVLLFGSGVEGNLQVTSDVNLLFVLKRFDKLRVDEFREPLRMACMAYNAAPMFVLESELAQVAEAFAVKFDDISRRHRVLYGEDPTPQFCTSRAARKQRLLQVLMNLILRLRERYASVSLREEKLVMMIAESLSPLRSAAMTLLDLEGRPAGAGNDALQLIASQVENATNALQLATQAREKRVLPPGAAAYLMFQLMALAEAIRLRAEKLN